MLVKVNNGYWLASATTREKNYTLQHNSSTKENSLRRFPAKKQNGSWKPHHNKHQNIYFIKAAFTADNCKEQADGMKNEKEKSLEIDLQLEIMLECVTHACARTCRG